MVRPPSEALAEGAAVPWTLTVAGLRLAVRVTPRAGRTRLDGVAAGADGRPALRIHLAAPPVDGAANAALIAFLAAALSLRKSDIRIVSGDTARLKIVQITGEPGHLAPRLAALAEGRTLGDTARRGKRILPG